MARETPLMMSSYLHGPLLLMNLSEFTEKYVFDIIDDFS